MSKEKEGKAKDNRKMPLMNLKEKRAAKAAKKADKSSESKIIIK
jgi:hypothetical protein